MSSRHSQQLGAGGTDPAKGIRTGHQLHLYQWGMRARVGSCYHGRLLRQDPLPTREVCELRISVGNQSEKEWTSSLIGLLTKHNKTGKVRVRISGQCGSLGFGFSSQAQSPSGMASAPEGPKQQVLPSRFSLLWKKDGPLARSPSQPRRCPTQQWPGSLHGRMSLWPGARPQTKALLELGLHPQADRTLPASLLPTRERS